MATAGIKWIGIFLFDDVEELDAVGPYEVLASWTRQFPEDGYRLVTLSADGSAVTAAKGMALGAQSSIAAAPLLDVFLHPGGVGTRALMRDDSHLDWVCSLAGEATIMTSVCTGSLVFAAAGLLRGRRATTHWASLDLLASLDPTIEVDPDSRFVDIGNLITSAGVSAGIDMALHLVARLAGTGRARAVRREIQYDPYPPV